MGFSVLATMVKTGLWFNAQTVNTLLHGLCNEGSMVAAVELFNEMVEEERLCNEISYVTIINGFCKAGETSKALELLKHLRLIVSVQSLTNFVRKGEWMRH